MRKFILITSLILNFVFIAFFIGKRIYYSRSFMVEQKHLKELRSMPIKDSDIVFIGNSLTEAFPLEQMFPSEPVRNRGVSGNKSKDVLKRITPIAKAKPQKIFLDVGINDILRNVSLDTLFINYKSIIKIIQSNSPTSKIYIQSLLPVGNKYQSFRPKINAFNDTLQTFCKSNSITFINLFPLFYKGGLDPYYSTDSLHLNRSAYEVWRNAIVRYVN